MKKIMIAIILLVILYIYHYDEYNNIEDSIRFRVVANSNSSNDILMKEKVVKELSYILFDKTKSLEETEKNIYDNLKNIENKIDILFKNNNYNKNFNISYGMNRIPKKTYKGKVYEEGNYKSLVIEIGEAKGNNYFCILYPSLCLLDSEELNKGNNYKSKIIEYFEELF